MLKDDLRIGEKDLASSAPTKCHPCPGNAFRAGKKPHENYQTKLGHFRVPLSLRYRRCLDTMRWIRSITGLLLSCISWPRPNRIDALHRRRLTLNSLPLLLRLLRLLINTLFMAAT